MCGACAAGPARRPWEVDAHGGGRAAHEQRAREAQALVGRRATVSAYGAAGYLLRGRTGATSVHRDLDDLLAALVALAPREVATRARESRTWLAGVVVDRLEA